MSVHAHPDDETLLTGGTLARAAADGHRVVLVTATDGGAGLARSELTVDLAAVRLGELEKAAQALGVARLVRLGHGDSGMDGSLAGGLVGVPVATVGEQIAQVLHEERADLVTGYDPSGGYGHPDHVAVHHAVRAAALATGTRVLEATVDRESLRRVLSLVGWLPGLPEGFRPSAVDGRWTARVDLSHRVDVRPLIAVKSRALAAHRSQAGADSGSRTAAVLLALPLPLRRRVLGTEWFAEPGAGGSAAPSGDIWR